MSTTKLKLRQEFIHRAVYFKQHHPLLRFDFTYIMNEGSTFALIVDMMIEHIKALNADTVVGHGYGGAQLCAGIIAKEPSLKAIVIRGTMHETQMRQVEGSLKHINRAVLVDDAIFTGQGAQEAINLAKNSGIKPLALIVIYDDRQAAGLDVIKNEQMQLISLLDNRDIKICMKPNIAALPLFSPIPLWVDESCGHHNVEYSSAPCIYKHMVINADHHYRVTAYDALSGQIIWTINAPEPHAHTKVCSQQLCVEDDECLYIGWYNGWLVKIDANSGATQWAVKHADYIHSAPTVLDDTRIGLNVEIDTITGSSGKLLVLDRASGAILWEHIWNDYAPAPIAVTANCIIATANDKTIACFNKHTYNAQWQAETEHAVKTKPLVFKDNVYVVDNSGYFYGYKIATGERIFKQRGIANGWNVTPTLFNGLIALVDSTINGSPFMPCYGPGGRKRELYRLSHAGLGISYLNNDYAFALGVDGAYTLFKGLERVRLETTELGIKVWAMPAIDQSLGIIAMNCRTGGLRIYPLNEAYVSKK